MGPPEYIQPELSGVLPKREGSGVIVALIAAILVATLAGGILVISYMNPLEDDWSVIITRPDKKPLVMPLSKKDHKWFEPVGTNKVIINQITILKNSNIPKELLER